MALLKRGDLAAPALPREQVNVASLGGDVIVRGLMLSERIALFGDAPGAKREFAERIAAHQSMANMLSVAVLDADDEPLFTSEQWESFGAKQPEEFNALCAVAMRLAGFEDQKKSNANDAIPAAVGAHDEPDTVRA